MEIRTFLQILTYVIEVLSASVGLVLIIAIIGSIRADKTPRKERKAEPSTMIFKGDIWIFDIGLANHLLGKKESANPKAR